jgi:hypothetical protein
MHNETSSSYPTNNRESFLPEHRHLGEGALEALSDETAGAILRKSAWLPEKEKEMVLGIVRQFAGRSE